MLAAFIGYPRFVIDIFYECCRAKGIEASDTAVTLMYLSIRPTSAGQDCREPPFNVKVTDGAPQARDPF
jgi:hypothetical protein